MICYFQGPPDDGPEIDLEGDYEPPEWLDDTYDVTAEDD